MQLGYVKNIDLEIQRELTFEGAQQSLHPLCRKARGIQIYTWFTGGKMI